jgi:hypothetical protein
VWDGKVGWREAHKTADLHRTNEKAGRVARLFVAPLSAGLVVEETAEFARARGVLEFAQGFGFDLTDTFARDRELLADLFERVIGVHADAEAHAQDAFFAWRK